MPRALLVGGTRFLGRHAVEAFLAAGYDVTTFTRGRHPDPFAGRDSVSHVEGDRNDESALAAARDAVEPDVVVDLVAFVPEHVEAATEIFADAYVLVSSLGAYAEWGQVPLREGEAELHDYGPEHAVDDPSEADPRPNDSYGPRKAECDRAVFRAAADGVNALSVRPALVYGPHDYTERTDYWLHRLAARDRVLVPGDGDSLLHRVYAPDAARAIRLVAEEGAPGEAYNVADRRATTLDGWLALAADALDADPALVHASARELAAHGLAPDDFPLYTDEPVVASTAKLHALGWESTPLDEAYAETVAEHRDSDRTGDHWGPDREVEEAVIDALAE